MLSLISRKQIPHLLAALPSLTGESGRTTGAFRLFFPALDDPTGTTSSSGKEVRSTTVSCIHLQAHIWYCFGQYMHEVSSELQIRHKLDKKIRLQRVISSSTSSAGTLLPCCFQYAIIRLCTSVNFCKILSPVTALTFASVQLLAAN